MTTQSRVYSNDPENTNLTGAGELVPVNPDGIPDPLKAFDHWVVWRVVLLPSGKMDKQPYQANNADTLAKTNDSRTLATFEEAYAAYEKGAADGVGFVFSSLDPFVGVDLDNCRNPATGHVEEWARQIIDGFKNKYVEVSPSGKGVHVITTGSFLETGINTDRFEMYGWGRFFTITGVAL